MAELRYGKCFNTQPKVDLKLPPYRHDYDFIKRITYIDAETVPGADFYNECMWILPDPSTKEGKVFKDSHTHSWGQYLGFYVYRIGINGYRYLNMGERTGNSINCGNNLSRCHKVAFIIGYL